MMLSTKLMDELIAGSTAIKIRDKLDQLENELQAMYQCLSAEEEDIDIIENIIAEIYHLLPSKIKEE